MHSILFRHPTSKTPELEATSSKNVSALQPAILEGKPESQYRHNAILGPFYISLGLNLCAFLSGLVLLAGVPLAATRRILRLAHQAAAVA